MAQASETSSAQYHPRFAKALERAKKQQWTVETNKSGVYVMDGGCGELVSAYDISAIDAAPIEAAIKKASGK